MPAALKWRSKILLIKIESSYGVDPTPAAANGILATNVELSPMEGEDVSRQLEYPYLGAQPMIPTGLRATLSFSTELVGSGAAGTAPAWGPIARACALAQTVNAGVSVVYNPISSSHESVAVYFWFEATRHVLLGCRGTGVLSLDAQGIPRIRWTLSGLYAAPSEQSRVTPTLTGFKKPAVASDANTPAFSINAVDLVLRGFSLDLGNRVEPRLLIGREEILITDRQEAISARVEAVPLSTLDPFALAEDQTEIAVALTHGTAAGYITAVAAPTCQVMRMSGYENNQDVLEWPLRLTPLPASGNDQFSITLT